ncbi:MAG: DNA repair protein RecN [Burkholderiales bacterium]
MLRFLTISNFAIVERIEQEFEPGFTVLSGETGAGKSILVDALALTLGERADTDVLRDSSQRAELAAEFDVGRLPRVIDWLRDNDLETDPGVCLMRRSIDTAGRSRCFINGRAVALQQMREVGEWLVDIHGQHAHQSLLKGEVQRQVLDAYAGLCALVEEVATAHRDWQALRATRLALEQDSAALLRECEQLQWQQRELTALEITPSGWQELLAEHVRLAHAAALLEGAQYALQALSEGEAACCTQLDQVLARLTDLQSYDARLDEALDLLQPARIQLQEAAHSLRSYRDRLEIDPKRLEQVENRMTAIHACARKYRVAPEALPELLEKTAIRLYELGETGGHRDLGKREAAAQAVYIKHARELSARRATAAQDLSEKVTAAMQTLSMKGGAFCAQLAARAEGDAHGLEQIEFQVSSHAGGPLKPLAKVASGGELSRISLAIQAIASRAAAVPTLIFDEVDVGIGGKAAEIVGQMLNKLGERHQVLCVTHLPQVAACGDRQMQIVKSVANGRALSHINVLDARQRVEEIARMLGGIKITDTTRKHAAEMLGEGAPAVRSRKA